MNRFLLIGLLMLKGICTTVAAPLLSVVTGTVQDASTGEAVIGAAVILQNTTQKYVEIWEASKSSRKVLIFRIY